MSIAKTNVLMDEIRINITGDTFLGERIEPVARQNPESLFDTKIVNLFANAHLNIVNLESSLSDAGNEHRINKNGPHLKASPQTIGVLDLLKVNLVTLANNHIYDFGDKGLTDTLHLCAAHNIATVGAGSSLSEASRIWLREIDGIKIAVLNITENEESVATRVHGGANPMDIVANTRSLHEAKKVADVVILIVHGGHELYHYPSPRMVDQYRYYAEEGASIIVGHHSHFISGFEIYQKVPIFYGLGNFLFHNNTQFSAWYEGILLNITINRQKEISWLIHPVLQCKNGLKVELSEDIEKSRIENEILSMNPIIADPELLEQKFTGLIHSQKDYLLSIYSTSFIFKFYFVRAAIRKLGLEKFFLRKEQLKSILNYTSSESLRDIASKVIDNYIHRR